MQHMMEMMKIKSIELKNYRQYRNVELKFGDDNLVVIIGLMGTGKTNLLNAINWCFYDDEPYFSKNLDKLPIPNLKEIENKEKDINVGVKIEINYGEKTLLFRRGSIFNKYNKEITTKNNIFKLEYYDENNNLKEFNDESIVELLFPKSLRDYFFFDGEKLDRYFREATAENVKKSVFNISEISVLERVIDRLEKTKCEYQKEASKLSPNIESINSKLKEKQEDINVIEEEIKVKKQKISEMKENINLLNEELKNVPDIRKLIEENEKYKKELDEMMKNYDMLRKQKLELILEMSRCIYLYDAIKHGIDIIEKKREIGEIPPTNDKKLLKNILNNRVCICGKIINNGSDEERRINELINKINISQETAEMLQKIEPYLNTLIDNLTKSGKKNRSLTLQIKNINDNIAKLQEKINNNQNVIKNNDDEKVKLKYGQLDEYNEMLNSEIKALGALDERKKQREKEITLLNRELDDELKKDQKLKKLEKRIKLCNDGISLMRNYKNSIMNNVRQSIEKKTWEYFNELMWKKDTFVKLIINEDYEIKLIHKYGYDSLGTLSGGEREVLALAFTMALHEISRYNSPIIIDRPFAMVSGDSIQEIMKIFIELSKRKQIILLLTPEDYRNVEDILNRVKYKKYTLNFKETDYQVICKEN